jgi:hypothetical protein
VAYEEQLVQDNVGEAADANYLNHLQQGVGAADSAAAAALAAVEAETARAEAAETLLGATNAPGITNPGPRTASVGVPIELRIVATGASSYSAVKLPAGLTINTATGAIKGTPTTVETVETVVTVNGPGGTSSTAFTWTVSAAAAPTVTKPAAQTAVVGTPLTALPVVATNTTSYAATSLPAGLSINAVNGNITGTPTAVETPTTTIKVTGPGGTAETTFAWTVTAEPALPVIRAGEPKAESTGTTQQAPTPTAGTVTGDLLLMLVQLLTNTATLTIPSGWTQIGTLGNIGVHNFYVLARIYDGSATPLLTASVSTEWDVRIISIQGGEAVTVNSTWNNQASSTTLAIASVTTTANELVLSLSARIGGTSESTPAGWTAFNTKNQFRIYYKNQAGAEASGATSATLGVAEASTAITLAVSKTAAVTGITEKLSTDHLAVEPVSLPSGTANIAVARCTAESGQDENTQYETVPTSTTRMLGTISHPWIALRALNATGEAIGAYTPRIKTTPVALAPTVTKPTTQGANVSKATSLQIAATESPTSYAATSLPPGLTVNAGTGLISGTPTTAGTYTPSLTATNAVGASAAVTFSWVIGAAVGSTLTTGFVNDVRVHSAATITVIGFGAHVVRDEYGIGSAASEVKAAGEFFQSHGTLFQPLAGFNARLPSEAEAKGLAAWAAALAPLGVKYIEFGNETNYSGQVANTQANGETYGKRAKEAAEAIQSSGIKLLVQGSDAGIVGNTEWLDGIYAVWPGIATHAAFGGWTIHAYPAAKEFPVGATLVDTWGIPMMERMVKRLEFHGDSTSPIFDTEWGAHSTAAGTTMTDGGSLDWSEAARMLEAHIPKLETASKKRLTQLLLYQATDQRAEGELNREYYFGALTVTGGSKGAFTAFAEKFL